MYQSVLLTISTSLATREGMWHERRAQGSASKKIEMCAGDARKYLHHAEALAEAVSGPGREGQEGLGERSISREAVHQL